MNIEYVREAARSKQLNYMNGPMVIISANGMAENGRILHHLKNNIEDSDNTVLIVSFQAESTLGRRIQEGQRRVRIFGEEYDVRANVASIEGYSAHADQRELIAWARPANGPRLQHTFLVHGEPNGAFALADKLRQEGFKQVTAPERGQSFEF